MKIACVAGETSGDLLAGSVLQGLRTTPFAHPLELFGIGGPAMQAQGLEALWTIDALSVRGYVEVLAALPRLLWRSLRAAQTCSWVSMRQTLISAWSAA
jgi:lipid-A-disaccharide synthase